METQKIVNLLNGTNNESSKFATRKWCIINDQNNGQYGEGGENDSTVKFETKVIKSSLCDYSDAYILVTGNTTATGVNANTNVALKNCAPFTRCVTHINNKHVETAENLDIIMPMYNLLEYSDNYADSSGILWQFKGDEQNMNGNNIADVSTADSSSFKYKSSLLRTPKATGALENAKIVVLLKYLSNFFRSLEMPLINCKIHLKSNWTKNCVMSSAAGITTIQITITKLYVPIVTLSIEDNVNLTKQLNEGFKRSVYWNEYKSKVETKNLDNNNVTSFPLDASFQGVSKLYVLAFNDATLANGDDDANRVKRDSHRKYFLPRVDITNYNVLIDGRNFYGQSINNQIKKYDEIRNISTGKRDVCTTGCLLDYQYFKNHYQLIAVDLSKQKELDAGPRAIQQLNFMKC